MANADRSIPAPSDRSQEACPGPNGERTPVARKPGILVVEDEGLVRFMLETGLRQQGFAVWLAANGLEAIEVFHRHRGDIDLVLLDVRMPGLDGPKTWTILERLNPSLRCCFMTGDLGRYTEEELLQLHAARVFRKPFKIDQLGATFHHLYDQQRALEGASG
jgi:CheY-like chemotaxis protein